MGWLVAGYHCQWFGPFGLWVSRWWSLSMLWSLVWAMPKSLAMESLYNYRLIVYVTYSFTIHYMVYICFCFYSLFSYFYKIINMSYILFSMSRHSCLPTKLWSINLVIRCWSDSYTMYILMMVLSPSIFASISCISVWAIYRFFSWLSIGGPKCAAYLTYHSESGKHYKQLNTLKA